MHDDVDINNVLTYLKISYSIFDVADRALGPAVGFYTAARAAMMEALYFLGAQSLPGLFTVLNEDEGGLLQLYTVSRRIDNAWIALNFGILYGDAETTAACKMLAAKSIIIIDMLGQVTCAVSSVAENAAREFGASRSHVAMKRLLDVSEKLLAIGVPSFQLSHRIDRMLLQACAECPRVGVRFD